MPRFSLRTLIVVMLLGGPVLALAWWLQRELSSNQEVFVPEQVEITHPPSGKD